MFSGLGVFCNGIRDLDAFEKANAENLMVMNDKLDLLWIACGRDDFLFERYQKTLEFFREKNINYVEKTTGGGHSWQNWRPYLHEFAQLIFKEQDIFSLEKLEGKEIKLKFELRESKIFSFSF